eukprot:gene12894-biopygen21523
MARAIGNFGLGGAGVARACPVTPVTGAPAAVPPLSNLPLGKGTTAFCTQEASGSTSQAANIMEALELGSHIPAFQKQPQRSPAPAQPKDGETGAAVCVWPVSVRILSCGPCPVRARFRFPQRITAAAETPLLRRCVPPGSSRGRNIDSNLQGVWG